MNTLDCDSQALCVSVIQKNELFSFDLMDTNNNESSNPFRHCNNKLVVSIVSAPKQYDVDTEIHRRWCLLNKLINELVDTIVCIIFCSMVSGATNQDIVERIYQYIKPFNLPRYRQDFLIQKIIGKLTNGSSWFTKRLFRVTRG